MTMNFEGPSGSMQTHSGEQAPFKYINWAVLIQFFPDSIFSLLFDDSSVLLAAFLNSRMP